MPAPHNGKNLFTLWKCGAVHRKNWSWPRQSKTNQFWVSAEFFVQAMTEHSSKQMFLHAVFDIDNLVYCFTSAMLQANKKAFKAEKEFLLHVLSANDNENKCACVLCANCRTRKSINKLICGPTQAKPNKNRKVHHNKSWEFTTLVMILQSAERKKSLLRHVYISAQFRSEVHESLL